MLGTEFFIWLAPLPEEDDLGAEQYVFLIENILSLYRKELLRVITFAVSNCFVNKKPSSRAEILLIG